MSRTLINQRLKVWFDCWRLLCNFGNAVKIIYFCVDSTDDAFSVMIQRQHTSLDMETRFAPIKVSSAQKRFNNIMNNNLGREIPAIVGETAEKDKIRILFVCLGNICRSPAAETVMEGIVESRNCTERFVLDSAGLYGGHAGEPADKRMRVHASRRGYSITHRSRPVRVSDFDNFDLIVAMDQSNFDRLRDLAPSLEDERKVVRMIDFVKGFPYLDCVPDPYYDGAEGFELVLDLLEDGCVNLFEELCVK